MDGLEGGDGGGYHSNNLMSATNGTTTTTATSGHGGGHGAALKGTIVTDKDGGRGGRGGGVLERAAQAAASGQGFGGRGEGKVVRATPDMYLEELIYPAAERSLERIRRDDPRSAAATVALSGLQVRFSYVSPTSLPVHIYLSYLVRWSLGAHGLQIRLSQFTSI